MLLFLLLSPQVMDQWGAIGPSNSEPVSVAVIGLLYELFHDSLSADYFASHLVSHQVIPLSIAALKAFPSNDNLVLQTVPLLLRLAVRPPDIFVYNEEALKSLRTSGIKEFSPVFLSAIAKDQPPALEPIRFHTASNPRIEIQDEGTKVGDHSCKSMCVLRAHNGVPVRCSHHVSPRGFILLACNSSGDGQGQRLGHCQFNQLRHR